MEHDISSYVWKGIMKIVVYPRLPFRGCKLNITYAMEMLSKRFAW